MGWVVKKSNKKRMNRGIHAFAFGAQERTRTSTPLPALGPEPSASTKSATWAIQEGEF